MSEHRQHPPPVGAAAPEARIPIHPELVAAARWLPRHVTNRVTLRPQRVLTRMAQAFTRRGPEPVAVTVSASLTLFWPAGEPPKAGPPLPALLWIHGGGFVAGSVRQDLARCADMAAATGALVAAVTYRKAPEHPYPAALHDCLAALRALRVMPGVDPERVAVAGASAGGGLAAALALRVRDVGDPPLAAQLLLYPMLDDRTGKHADERHFRLWEHRSNAFAWKVYLGDADPSAAVPARAASLERLPPTWIGVGTNDLFLAESRDYAARLRASGVPCELAEVHGAWHAFDGFVPMAAVSQRFAAEHHGFARRALAVKA